MNSIITDIAQIIKSETNIIKRERALIVYFLELISTLMAAALTKVDDELVEEVKSQGYQIDRKNERSVVTMLGEVRYTRRRYTASGKKARYPLDELMGFTKYQKYSPLAVRNLAAVSSRMTYRNASMAAELLSAFSVSHAQINKLVIQAGQNIQEKQTSDERYDVSHDLKKVKVLYLEGDGVVIKGQEKHRMEFHRYQVCEGFRNITFKRRERINARDFVSFTRKQALREIREYITNTYDLTDTLIISNADGGAGYTKADFDDICGTCLRHEHFLDVFHINEKIKDRLCFAPELQGRLIRAIEVDYDKEAVETILTTAESKLIDGLDTAINREHVLRLRSYINRRWEDMKPWRMRRLKNIYKGIGTCESNHRSYTYRVKGQGRYWTKRGAEAMNRIICALKNNDLDYWMSAEFRGSSIRAIDEEKYKQALKQSLKKTHEDHIGVQIGRIQSYVAGNSGLDKMVAGLNRY